jgi:hypothetical protein
MQDLKPTVLSTWRITNPACRNSSHHLLQLKKKGGGKKSLPHMTRFHSAPSNETAAEEEGPAECCSSWLLAARTGPPGAPVPRPPHQRWCVGPAEPWGTAGGPEPRQSPSPTRPATGPQPPCRRRFPQRDLGPIPGKLLCPARHPRSPHVTECDQRQLARNQREKGRVGRKARARALHLCGKLTPEQPVLAFVAVLLFCVCVCVFFFSIFSFFFL